MLRSGNVLLACLLLVAAFSGHVDAARSGDEDPYLILPPGTRPDAQQAWRPRDLGEKVFTLRHIYHHGTHDYPNLHRYQDIPKNAQLYTTDVDGVTKLPVEKKLRARAVSTQIERMTDRTRQSVDNLLEYAGNYGHAMTLPASAWTIDDISGPNYTDKSTVITFAMMANNAYTEEPFTGGWQDVKGGFNYTDDFGWQSDGLRGHIFADETNKTVVIGLKGTSMAVFDGQETTGNDKLNDNLFGSCCCAQGVHYTWKPVCDCKGDGYTCNATCVRKALNEKSHYYWAAKDLYHNVTERYPGADVWFSGHSLGGVVGTLIGLTFGLPVITFEAYPDALAASRLGLPTPPGYHAGMHQSRPDTAIHHFGHTADPIYNGSCGTAGSLCTIAGYAFESSCHTGQKCVYDTVTDFGWRSSVVNHKIITMITEVLEKYDNVANCSANLDCQDCYIWKFFESNGTETSTSVTSTSTSRTRTRTETCKTPGWWGCLDETTTTTGSTTSTSSISTSSTTCLTPGWFGCLDSTTTSTSSTVATPSASPAPTMTTTTSVPTLTSSCSDPGWFGGCNDPTSTSPVPSSTMRSSSSSATSSHTCTSKAWFGFVCLDPSSTSSTSTPSPTRLPTTRRKCVARHWYGLCKEWVSEPAAFKSDL